MRKALFTYTNKLYTLEKIKEINSFIESNYDSTHMTAVVLTLISVRGAASMLNFYRAAAVINSCVDFIDSVAANNFDQENGQGVLETMADALIALEYYFSEIELHNAAPPSVLDVAEKSLAALGFAVE